MNEMMNFGTVFGSLIAEPAELERWQDAQIADLKIE